MTTLDQSAEPSELSADRPIESAEEDRLGFKPLADRLAAALIDQASSDGLVVGIEGTWGSGKSSLLNLIARSLRALPEAVQPVVVEFKPWLIGDRDALLGSFFSQLATEIETVEMRSGHSAIADKRRRKELGEHIRQYAANAEVFGSILSVLPGAGPAATVLKQLGAAAKKRGVTQTPLTQQKQQLDKSLANLAQRIVVTIDDVDRLEPREAIELLRLVRSVADFKNIIYVLCYDGEILARSVETAVQVSDGASYLEKIVQVAVAVPIPEPFQLRRWFEIELGKFRWNLGEEDRERLRRIVDLEGGRRLATPRHVVRVLNTLRLLAPALRDEIDFADLVWLQLVKTGNHKLYRWIEAYCAAASAASSGRVSIGTESVNKEQEELDKLLVSDGLTFKSCRYELSEILPGVSPGLFRESDEPAIHRKVQRQDLETAIRGRRLASPDHYRLYFALAVPSSAPSTKDFDRLFEAASSSAKAVAETLRSWMAQTDPTIGSKADLMLDRLQQGTAAALSPEQCERVVLGMADVMDEAAAISPRDDLGSPGVWRQAERALPSLLNGVEKDRRLEVISASFGLGCALGWLTTLLRHEIFGHGRFGSQRADETRWLLSEAELDRAIEQMASRYNAMTIDEFAALPNALSALFAWSQSGHDEEARAFIGAAAESDMGLIRTLEIMANRVHSTGGDYNVLRRENLSPFLDYDTAMARLNALLQTVDANLRPRVAELMRNFESAESF